MTFNFDAMPEEPLVAGSGPERSAGSVQGAAEPAGRRRAVLVGQPNVGKSVVFGALTGTYVTVSNYPGTTVEITRGRATFGDQPWEVVDTPGTHNLVPMSEDEAVTRDMLLSEPHDAVVQIGDAKNLPRTLLLTLQLAELGVPFCLDLNMLDEARARGLSTDLTLLARELEGVGVNASTATEGEGLDGVREYLARAASAARDGAPAPLSCAPAFPDDVEAAIAAVEAHVRGGLPVAKRAVATMLLAGERGLGAGLGALVDEEARAVARDHAAALARAHGVPVFALLSRLRLSRAQAIVRRVQRRDDRAGARAHAGHVPWGAAVGLAALASLVAAAAYDGAVARLRVAAGAGDPLADYGFFDVVARVLSGGWGGLAAGWSAGAAALFGVTSVLGAVLLRRHAHARAGCWKLVAAFAGGWLVYFVASNVEWLVARRHSALPVHAAAIAGAAAVMAAALAGDRKDAAISRALGHAATHPIGGLPLVGVVLLLAYKIVGVFGAGTAVDFVENRVFGGVAAEAALDAPQPPGALVAGDVADDGTERLVVLTDGPSRVRVVAQTKVGGVYVDDPRARIDVYAARARTTRAPGAVVVEGDLRGAGARVWSGHVNRLAYRLFRWIGVPLLTAFFVGPYGLLTMGVTYAVAIVLPVVTTFFFVFSVLEDSGYLPRLAVMSNRLLRGMGLNGKAVLPMVLGLGCDTMATLTARIMETRKERMLVTLLLALGIPCSSQLSVIFALMQRTSMAATAVWVAVVIGTLLGVGWVAARVLPGDRSDFLLEMPPIRQPMVSNIVAKTMARIEWYLKEAVPLFLVGTALLFTLDALHLLVLVHRAGEPIVHHLLGFPRAAAVSDRVSEALLVGFLRRDFGAAGLLDLARAGKLSAADVAVSMVTITLFIPCIANVFMIAKERGWKVAGAMSAFIFPYAIAVGALVRAGFRAFGG
ncbi:MAG TPA: FeoB small GTPase domain-containing protein [Polyangiaceae bacterium]|nr:FeoB small GTPase domain-containing protein [Polyangiaceae bacterium]